MSKKSDLGLLKNSEKLYSKLFESVTDALFLIRNADGTILKANEGVEKMYGYNQEELATLKNTDLSAEPEKTEKATKSFDNLLDHSIKIPIRYHKKKNGTIFPVEITGQFFILDNSPVHLITIKDISSRLKNEEALKQTQEKFREVFMNATVGISITSIDGFMEMNNAYADILGYTKEELLNKNWRELTYPNDIPYNEEIVKEVLAGRKTRARWEKRFLHKDGHIVWADISTVLQRDKEGNPYVFITTINDITKQKEIQIELMKAKEIAEKSDLIKTEFLNQMSHEIRTPINVILSSVNLIGEVVQGKLDKEYEDLFPCVENASKRIIRTIDSILNMSELQSGLYEPTLKEINLDTLVIDPLYTEYKRSAEAKGIRLIYSKNCSDVIVNVDEYSIIQVFANLIDNAIKYTLKGFVQISLEKQDHDVLVEIKDTGIGISDEFLPLLFSPFHQEEQGYTRGFEGNGLGLALVKRYCHINNAVLDVKSKKHEGTTFRILFKGID
ncbi:MAG: PAS domain S-box protein [Melioribacteraceae bacterium]|nr:PAS domain S-box protein [Melioribacteraceae bacterium]